MAFRGELLPKVNLSPLAQRFATVINGYAPQRERGTRPLESPRQLMSRLLAVGADGLLARLRNDTTWDFPGVETVSYREVIQDGNGNPLSTAALGLSMTYWDVGLMSGKLELLRRSGDLMQRGQPEQMRQGLRETSILVVAVSHRNDSGIYIQDMRRGPFDDSRVRAGDTITIQTPAISLTANKPEEINGYIAAWLLHCTKERDVTETLPHQLVRQGAEHIHQQSLHKYKPIN